jgi:hypothetical protein
MKRTCRATIISGLCLVLIWAGMAAGADVTFTGKIQEIRQAIPLDRGKTEKFFTLKLDSRPNSEFQLSADDAARYGLIDPAGLSQVVTPKHNKGLGWTVKVTCDKEYKGPVNAPVYQVKSLERIDD